MSSRTCKQEENGKKYLVFREKSHQHRFLYHVIFFLKSEGEIGSRGSNNHRNLLPLDLHCK